MECYRSYARYLEEQYGKRVYRIGLDGYFSCPNRDEEGNGGCAFCDGNGSSSTYQRINEQGYGHFSAYDQDVSRFSGRCTYTLAQRISLLTDQIRRGKAFVERRYRTTAFSLYFQAYTSTYDSIENLKAIFDAALSEGPFVELIVSTRPDCVSASVVSLLSGYKGMVEQVWVELGLESATQESLDFVGRNHSVESYILATNSLHSAGIFVCTHVMLGLLHEGHAAYARTAALVTAVSSDAVKIHNLHVCGGTRLADWYEQGEVSVASLRRYVEVCVFFLRNLDPSIVIERLMCETPSHRLVAPRTFPDKTVFLAQVRQMMEANGWTQGDLL